MPVATFPVELLFEILQYVELNDLIRCMAVSRPFRSAARRQRLFTRHIHIHAATQPTLTRVRDQLDATSVRRTDIELSVRLPDSDSSGFFHRHVLDILRDNMDRIVTLKVTSPDRLVRDLGATLSTRAAPRLRQFAWLQESARSAAVVPLNLFASSAPNLTAVVLKNVEFKPQLTPARVPAFQAVESLLFNSSGDIHLPVLLSDVALLPKIHKLAGTGFALRVPFDLAPVPQDVQTMLQGLRYLRLCSSKENSHYLPALSWPEVSNIHTIELTERRWEYVSALLDHFESGPLHVTMSIVSACEFALLGAGQEGFTNWRIIVSDPAGSRFRVLPDCGLCYDARGATNVRGPPHPIYGLPGFASAIVVLEIEMHLLASLRRWMDSLERCTELRVHRRKSLRSFFPVYSGLPPIHFPVLQKVIYFTEGARRLSPRAVATLLDAAVDANLQEVVLCIDTTAYAEGPDDLSEDELGLTEADHPFKSVQ